MQQYAHRQLTHIKLQFILNTDRIRSNLT